MDIDWIKCTDKMPPNDGTVIFARHPDIEKSYVKVKGYRFHLRKAHGFLDDKWEWTMPFKTFKRPAHRLIK